jgi:hypothetical protein
MTHPPLAEMLTPHGLSGPCEHAVFDRTALRGTENLDTLIEFVRARVSG